MVQRNGKIFCALRRINIVKMAILPKAMYKFNAYQNIHEIFHWTKMNNPEIYKEPQRFRTAKAILRKKEQKL